MPVTPIPTGYHSVTPYLVVAGLSRLVDFLKSAFGAELTRPALAGKDGRLLHAEMQIGDSRLMLGEAIGDFQPMQAALHLYVEDCDETYERALKAGASSVTPPDDQFYGDRSGAIQDPCGNYWWIATHVEDVTADELARRAREREG